MELIDPITLSEAAKELDVSKRWLQKHMAAGSAPEWVRIGREVVFSLPTLRQWMRDSYPSGKPRRGRRPA